MLHPSKILCVGRNYAAHAKELGNDVPTHPLLFLKPSSAIVPSGASIRRPAVSNQVEFEGEIGIVLGARLRKASEQDARAAIAGIVAVNDVTARDLQKSDGQWTRAKGFDTFCPVGEVAEAPEDLEALEVITRVNGAVRQHGYARDMVFRIPTLLAYASQVMTLEAGDLILTGTPDGVGTLEAGDVVEVEIPGLSRVTSSVEDDR